MALAVTTFEWARIGAGVQRVVAMVTCVFVGIAVARRAEAHAPYFRSEQTCVFTDGHKGSVAIGCQDGIVGPDPCKVAFSDDRGRVIAASSVFWGDIVCTGDRQCVYYDGLSHRVAEVAPGTAATEVPLTPESLAYGIAADGDSPLRWRWPTLAEFVLFNFGLRRIFSILLAFPLALGALKAFGPAPTQLSRLAKPKVLGWLATSVAILYAPVVIVGVLLTGVFSFGLWPFACLLIMLFVPSRWIAVPGVTQDQNAQLELSHLLPRLTRACRLWAMSAGLLMLGDMIGSSLAFAASLVLAWRWQTSRLPSDRANGGAETEEK